MVHFVGSDVGSDAWWQGVAEAGTPLVRSLPDGQAELSFLWRDPLGGPQQSVYRHVYLDVYSHTPHPTRQPTSMTRIGETDVWLWQTTVAGDWRGSYFLLPAGPGQDPPQERGGMRRWWIGLMEANAQADPLNRFPVHGNGSGAALSRIELAPSASAWDAQGAVPEGQLRTLRWHSTRLDNVRDVWLYRTGTGTGTDLPLVILLDGHYWARHMPIFGPLDALTNAGRLPPAVYLMIDALGPRQRSAELPCSAHFWEALQTELLPLAQVSSSAPQRTLVAGQSFGGLAAMYAGLHYPDRFGLVLSQSGSFWWPDPDETGDQGTLTQEVSQLARATLDAWIEVGCYETDMLGPNRAMRDALQAAGHQVRYREFRGGHDWFCWRDGLLEGLAALLHNSTRMDDTQ